MTTPRAKAGRIMRLPGIWYVAAVLVVGGGVLANSERMDREQQRQIEAACRRGNVVRAYLVLRAREFPTQNDGQPSRTTQLSPELFRLQDCANQKPMGLERQEQYLQTLQLTGRPPV